MNRYPLWVYITVAVALVVGLIYTLPNFYGESPAVQISSARATVKIDESTLERAEKALADAGIAYDGARMDPTGVKVRFADTDTQLRARDLLDQAFNPDPSAPDHTVALNLLPASPNWLSAIGAQPMYLGLDLRGGVHFLLQVDMQGAIIKRLDSYTGDIRSMLRDARVRHSGVSREGSTVVIRFRDSQTRAEASKVLTRDLPDLMLNEVGT